jgi:AraC-like DNA-binding protein
VTGPRFSDFHETDVGRAETEQRAAVRLDHAPASQFGFHTHTVTRGPLRVEATRCTDGIHVQVLTDEPTYAVGLPVRGPVHTDHRGRELDLGPGQAAVFTPAEEAEMSSNDRFDVLLVRVRSAALEDALEALLGRAVRRPLPLPASMALDTTAGAAWSDTVRLVADATPGATSVLASPMSAEPLQYALLARLLLASDHPEREALDARVPSWGPRTVRNCVDSIEDQPERPMTLASLAAEVGLSVRALEGCWMRHRSVPPGEDVGRVRLGRAHRDLEFYRPGETTVATVATSWGFRPEPFVNAYGTRFGRPPAQTLRGHAYA